MRIWALTLISLSCAFSQQIEFLNQTVSGRAIRDTSGNWILADDGRVRKFPPGSLSQTNFDIATPAGAVVSVKVDSVAQIFVLTQNSFFKLDRVGKVVANTPLAPVAGFHPVDFIPADNNEWIVAGYNGTSLVLIRLSPDGTVVRNQRTIDISPSPTLAGIAADAGGHFYISGSTGSDALPVTSGAFQSTRLSGTCFTGHFFSTPFPCPAGYVMKLDTADLHTIAATYLGGTRAVTSTGLAVDAQGAPYLTGYIERAPHVASDYPVTTGAYQTGFPGDGLSLTTGTGVPVVTKMTPDLSALAYSTFLAGSTYEIPTSIAVDTSGRAIVSGTTGSLDYPTTGVFQTLCGVKRANIDRRGYVSRLSADGSVLESSTILDRTAFLQFAEDPAGPRFAEDIAAVAIVDSSLIRVHLNPATGPVVACTLNGANFVREGFVGPSEVVTVKGGPFPEGTRLLFDGEPAATLYGASDQINAVVPRDLAGRAATLMQIEANGVRSNARQFSVRNPNPTVLVAVFPDGSIDDRGNPLAVVGLSDGSLNSETNPARFGDRVTIYVSGIDPAQSVSVGLNFNTNVQVLAVNELPGSAGSVYGIDIQVPPIGTGMQVIRIQNGASATADNPGFIWVM